MNVYDDNGKTFGDYVHSCVRGPRSASWASMPERKVILRARRGRVVFNFKGCYEHKKIQQRGS